LLGGANVADDAQQSKKVQMANALMVIVPYWYEGTWVFDDESVGLRGTICGRCSGDDW